MVHVSIHQLMHLFLKKNFRVGDERRETSEQKIEERVVRIPDNCVFQDSDWFVFEIVALWEVRFLVDQVSNLTIVLTSASVLINKLIDVEVDVST